MAKKKLLAYIMAGMLALASLTGCGSSKDGDMDSEKSRFNSLGCRRGPGAVKGND